MKIILSFLAVLSLVVSARAATYLGNGNSGFGGVLGTGSLVITDDGSNLNITFNKGAAAFNDYLVIYFDSPLLATGSSSLGASGEVGNPDGGRRSVANEFGSGVDAFAAGFVADYAFALRSNGSLNNTLYSIPNSANATTLAFVNNYAVSNFGSTSASSYSWSIPFADLGLTPSVSANDTFKFVATYLNPFSGAGSDATFRSNEAIGADPGGSNLGFTGITYTGSSSYTVTPEPSRALLLGIGLLGFLFRRRR